MSIAKSLENLSTKELAEMQSRITGIFAARNQKLEANVETIKAQMQAEVAGKLGRVLKEFGLPATAAQAEVSITVPNGNGAHKVKARKPRKAKIAVKYRDPANPANTWSGRGRPARWLAALEKQGKRREDFAVR